MSASVSSRAKVELTQRARLVTLALTLTLELTFFDRYKRTRLGTDIVGARTNQLVVCALLLEVSRPSGGSGHHEKGRKMRRWDSQEMVCCRAEEVGIREKLLLLIHYLFNLVRDIE